MQQLTKSFTVTLIAIILLGALSAQSMEQDCKQLALQAKANVGNPLFLLPHDMLNHIVAHCLSHDDSQVKSLANQIKIFMKLSIACKYLNRVLTFETIGNFCKNYSQYGKDALLRDLIKIFFAHHRLPVIIVICAGAAANTRSAEDISLLERAVKDNDAQLVKILFSHHADANVKTLIGYPVFYYAKTIEIAQMFIANNVDLHASGSTNAPSVLWHMARQEYPIHLLQFYLEQGLNPKQLDPFDNSCIFHRLAWFDWYDNNSANGLLKKAEILLEVAYEMINTRDKYGRTPCDRAQKSLWCAKRQNGHVFYAKAFEKLIALYMQKKSVVAQELLQ